MSEGYRDIDICIKLGLTEAALQDALVHIKERAQAESNDAGRLYERALRMNAEAERQSVEARFQALMETAPQSVLVVDGRSGIIRQANKRSADLFGYSVEELIGLKVEQLVPAEQRDIHVAYRIGFLRSVRKREMGYHPPIVALRKDGSKLEIAIALTATVANDDVMVVCSEFQTWSAQANESNKLQEPV